MTTSQIKVKLIELNKKQKELLPELRDRGFNVSGSELSAIITRSQQGPKADAVLSAIEDIIAKWEEFS